MKHPLLSAVAAGLIVTLIAYAVEATTLAGAHPRWLDQLALSGAIIGSILALIAVQFHFVQRSLGLSFLAIAAYVTADYGKTRFAASFAEDAIAGQMWFFGWHVLSVALIAHVVSVTYEKLRAA